MKFTAVLLSEKKTATGIQVPEEIIAALGTSKKPAVTVSFRGYTYRTTIGSMGGKFMIPVSADVRKASGVAAGDTLDIDIEIDAEPREVSVPDDFAAALAGDTAAEAAFNALSYSNRRRFTLSIEDAKTPETRQRRIEKSIATLKGD